MLGELAARGVVDVDDADAAELGGEQPGLGREVVVHGRVVVEVVLGQVGEQRDLVEAPADPAQVQRVAGDLHGRGGDAPLAHQREQRVQVGGLRRGQRARQRPRRPTRISTPPIRPVSCPAARSPASSRNVVVDLPLVPVTPMQGQVADGLARTPRRRPRRARARGSSTTRTGRPGALGAAPARRGRSGSPARPGGGGLRGEVGAVERGCPAARRTGRPGAPRASRGCTPVTAAADRLSLLD